MSKIKTENNGIIERQYGSYRGKAYKKLQIVHFNLWRHLGDKKFLLFLQKQERDNPTPTYTPLIINNGKETNT